MFIRHGKPEDIDDIMVIAEKCRAFMASYGNDGQWIDGYPQRELILEDMERGNSYVLEGDDGHVHGFFAFILGDDPTYAVIKGEPGRWLNDEPYGTIHRIGHDETVSGFVKLAVEYCFEKTDNIRIDTHEKNLPMRHLMEKYEFITCGTIWVSDGSPRIAYQKKKHKPLDSKL